MIAIERNYSIVSHRLININADFYSALNATKLERSIFGFVGIGSGLGLFIFLVSLQSKLAAKSSIEKSDVQSVKKPLSQNDKLVYCPICNLPFKTEKNLQIHTNNWHKEKTEKK